MSVEETSASIRALRAREPAQGHFGLSAGVLFVVLFALIDCHGSISGRELSFVSDVAHAAPWNTIPHVSWLGCEPTHCVNGGVRGPDSSGRWACGANSLEIVFDSANA